jgi:hypothetical protein
MHKGIVYDFDAWGPPIWTTMHIFTFVYPDKPTEDDRARAIQFFSIVPFFLPCGACGMHFVETLREHPLTDAVLVSRDSLSRWLNGVHNHVNRRLGKREVSYAEASDMFLHKRPVRRASGHGYRAATCVLAALLLAAIIVIVIMVAQARKAAV